MNKSTQKCHPRESEDPLLVPGTGFRFGFWVPGTGFRSGFWVPGTRLYPVPVLGLLSAFGTWCRSLGLVPGTGFRSGLFAFALALTLAAPSPAFAAREVRTEQDLPVAVQMKRLRERQKVELKLQNPAELTLEERVERLEKLLGFDGPNTNQSADAQEEPIELGRVIQ